jgi:hypothetical protein
MTPKYKILVCQLAVAISFRKWCQLRIAWAEETDLDNFEFRLIQGYAAKVDKFIGALEDYGNNISRYLLATDEHSRPESVAANRKISNQWLEELKPQIRGSLEDESGFAEGTDGLKSALVDACSNGLQFYDTLAKLSYSSPEVSKARAYFRGVSTGIIQQAGL